MDVDETGGLGSEGEEEEEGHLVGADHKVQRIVPQ